MLLNDREPQQWLIVGISLQTGALLLGLSAQYVFNNAVKSSPFWHLLAAWITRVCLRDRLAMTQKILAFQGEPLDKVFVTVSWRTSWRWITKTKQRDKASGLISSCQHPKEPKHSPQQLWMDVVLVQAFPLCLCHPQLGPGAAWGCARL